MVTSVSIIPGQWVLVCEKVLREEIKSKSKAAVGEKSLNGGQLKDQ